MRFVRRSLPLLALAGMVTAAEAAPVTGQISLGGYVKPIGSSGVSGATGLDFLQGYAGSAIAGTPGSFSYGAGAGAFEGLACASQSDGCGRIEDIGSLMNAGQITSFINLSGSDGQSVSFDLGAITQVIRNTASNTLNISGRGLLHITGYDATPGQFSLTTQGDEVASYSATLLASGPVTSVPEPTTWTLIAIAIFFAGSSLWRWRHGAGDQTAA